MTSLICGSCAQKDKLPKSQRIKLALSREPGERYWCPVCGKIHVYTEPWVKASPADPVDMEQLLGLVDLQLSGGLAPQSNKADDASQSV